MYEKTELASDAAPGAEPGVQRIVVTGVLLLLQAFWLFALFYWLADYAKWFGGVALP